MWCVSLPDVGSENVIIAIIIVLPDYSCSVYCGGVLFIVIFRDNKFCDGAGVCDVRGVNVEIPAGVVLPYNGVAGNCGGCFVNVGDISNPEIVQVLGICNIGGVNVPIGIYEVLPYNRLFINIGGLLILSKQRNFKNLRIVYIGDIRSIYIPVTIVKLLPDYSIAINSR